MASTFEVFLKEVFQNKYADTLLSEISIANFAENEDSFGLHNSVYPKNSCVCLLLVNDKNCLWSFEYFT